MKYVILRIGYVVVSLVIAYVSYVIIYNAFLSFLPPSEHLNTYSISVSPELRLYRESYIKLFEKSVIASVIVFIFSVLTLEYIFSSFHFRYNETLKAKGKILTAYAKTKNTQDDIQDEKKEEFVRKFLDL